MTRSATKGKKTASNSGGAVNGMALMSAMTSTFTLCKELPNTPTGLILTKDDKGFFLIADVEADSLAAKAGAKLGQKIFKVNGRFAKYHGDTMIRDAVGSVVIDTLPDLTKSKEPTFPQVEVKKLQATTKSNGSKMSNSKKEFEAQVLFDRPSRVFYAGERVAGCVEVKVFAETICCSKLELVFQGKAAIRHVDEDTSHLKQAVLQAQRHTAVGQVHKSLALYRLGRAVKFDAVPGSGILHLPCNEGALDLTKTSLHLKLREESKRDDPAARVLGEATINVASLLSSEGKKWLPLFKDGEQLKSKVAVSVDDSLLTEEPPILVLRVHEANFPLPISLGGGFKIYAQASFSKDDMAVGKTLAKGTHTFPFSFRLEQDSPDSIVPYVHEKPNKFQYYSYVKYSIDIRLGKGRSHYPRTVLITVIPTGPVPALRLLTPVSKDQVRTFWTFRKPSPSLAVTLKLDRSAYAPGEQINLQESVVRNETRQNQPVRIILRKYIQTRFATKQDKDPYPWREDTVLLETTCPSGVTQTLGVTSCNFFLNLPSSMHPSYLRDFIKPDEEKIPLQITYTLELRIGADKSEAGVSAYARVPLLICGVPPEAGSIAAAKCMPAAKADSGWEWSQCLDTSDQSTQLSRLPDLGSITSPRDLSESHLLFLKDCQQTACIENESKLERKSYIDGKTLAGGVGVGLDILGLFTGVGII